MRIKEFSFLDFSNGFIFTRKIYNIRFHQKILKMIFVMNESDWVQNAWNYFLVLESLR